MSAQVLDAMDDISSWVARAADGVTPSTELTIAADPAMAGWGGDAVSARIRAGAAASGHRLQRDFAAVDLTGFSQLRLSVKIDAAPSAEFLIEVRLASAGVGFDDAANTWHRLIPTGPSRGWTVLTMSLEDLPATVARGVTGIRLRCLTGSFGIHLDDMVAVRPQPLADADAALLAVLRGIIAGGNAVTSVIRAPGEPAPAAPGIDVEQFDIRLAKSRVIDAPLRCDFTVDGYRECVAGIAFDLDYAVRPVAANRATQAQLLEAVLARIPANGELVINGDRAPIELVTLVGTDRVGGSVGDAPTLVYRVGVRSPAVVGPAIIRVERIELDVDLREAS
jgi:hypothetical protein